MTMGKIRKKLDVQFMQMQINYHLEVSISFKMEIDTMLVIYFPQHRCLVIPFSISTFMDLLTLSTMLSGKWECLLIL